MCTTHINCQSKGTVSRSPDTGVTIEDINNNTPTYTVINTNRVVATNVNNDEDTNRVTASNINTITNSNFGRAFGDAPILETRTDTCTSTYTVSKLRGSKRKKFFITI